MPIRLKQMCSICTRPTPFFRHYDKYRSNGVNSKLRHLKNTIISMGLHGCDGEVTKPNGREKKTTKIKRIKCNCVSPIQQKSYRQKEEIKNESKSLTFTTIQTAKHESKIIFFCHFALVINCTN